MNQIARRLAPPVSLDLPPEEPQRAARPRPRQSGPFGVLDIGTTKIACIIARAESDGSVRVLGFGWQRGRGIRAGAVLDLEVAERAIRAAVGQAEEEAGVRLGHVTVNLSAGAPESRLFNVQWPVGGRAVTEHDIRRIVSEGRARAETDGRNIQHALPLAFAADTAQGVTDPRGLFCDTLSATLHVIDAQTTALRSLDACLARCDLEIRDLVSAPMAAGMATLVEDERELGAIVLDLGGGTTGIAMFTEGRLMHTAQLPVGGAHITNDIARGLSTPVAHAERLKTLYGAAHASPDDEREMLPVPLVGEEEHAIAKVPRSMLVAIIRPRLEEILELAKDRIEAAGPGRASGNRLVLTGGGAQLSGIGELAGRMLGRQVRIARPEALRGLPDAAASTGFATTVGLVKWVAGEGRTLSDLDLDAAPAAGWVQRIRRFIRERL